MVPEDIASHLESLQVRFAELEKLLADPALYSDPEKSRKVGSEHRKLEKMFRDFAAWKKALADIDTNKEMIASEEDPEMRALAEDDLAAQQQQAVELENALQIALLPPDPNDERNIIVEIKPAAGGDEAALFAGELSRAYLKYAESREWRVEILDQSNSDLGGIKNITFSLTGNEVYSRMKFESGVHRVQRVPETEAGGRIHTSTATVAVLPEMEEVDVEIRPEDIEMQVYRSSGAGGQHINKTSSAVRLIHKPTGIVVSCQTERSQFQNRDNCMKMLRSKLVEIKEREHLDKISDIKGVQKKIEWGSQIRNYVFMPYTLVKDTRTGCETSNVNAVMDGALDPFINAYLTCAATGTWVTK